MFSVNYLDLIPEGVNVHCFHSRYDTPYHIFLFIFGSYILRMLDEDDRGFHVYIIFFMYAYFVDTIKCTKKIVPLKDYFP